LKRASVLVLVMLAMTASAAVDARALAHEGRKTQWAPTRNCSSLNARAVFASESRRATSPYAGEEWETAAGEKDWQYAAGNPTRFTDPSGRSPEDRDEARYQACERTTPGQCGGGSGMRKFLSGSADAVCGTVDDVVGTPRSLVGVVGNAQGVDVFSQECVSRERRDAARATLAFAGFSMLREKAESTAQFGQFGLVVPSSTAQQRFVAETGHQWVEGARAWSVGDYYTAGNQLTPAAVKTGMFVVPAARATRALAGPALEVAALSAYLRLAPLSLASAEQSAAVAFSRMGAPSVSVPQSMVTLFHGTSSNSAAKILGSSFFSAEGFAPGLDGSVYFTNDLESALYFAREQAARTSGKNIHINPKTGKLHGPQFTPPQNLTVIKLDVPSDLYRELFSKRPIIEPRPIEPGATAGLETRLSDSNLGLLNAAIKQGTVKSVRLKFPATPR
jgi:hypothetical protein